MTLQFLNGADNFLWTENVSDFHPVIAYVFDSDPAITTLLLNSGCDAMENGCRPS
jgi:hypothetical protein